MEISYFSSVVVLGLNTHIQLCALHAWWSRMWRWGWLEGSFLQEAIEKDPEASSFGGGVCQFAFPLAMPKSCWPSTFFLPQSIASICILAILVGGTWHRLVLFYIFLIANDVENLPTCLLTVCIFYEVSVQAFCHF